MKLKASPKRGHRLKLRLENDDSVLPAIPLAEIVLNRILVPTDFSDSSRKVVHYAASLAKQFGAEIILLHVVEAAKRLAKWHRELDVAAVKAKVREGTPCQEIITAAEETNTDLIIIATHGRSRLSQMFIGGTAERGAARAVSCVGGARARP